MATKFSSNIFEKPFNNTCKIMKYLNLNNVTKKLNHPIKPNIFAKIFKTSLKKKDLDKYLYTEPGFKKKKTKKTIGGGNNTRKKR